MKIKLAGSLRFDDLGPPHMERPSAHFQRTDGTVLTDAEIARTAKSISPDEYLRGTYRDSGRPQK